MFNGEDVTGGGCFSALGRAPGFLSSDTQSTSGVSSIDELGAPAGWQEISLGDGCEGPGVVMHEVTFLKV